MSLQKVGSLAGVAAALALVAVGGFGLIHPTGTSSWMNVGTLVLGIIILVIYIQKFRHADQGDDTR